MDKHSLHIRKLEEIQKFLTLLDTKHLLILKVKLVWKVQAALLTMQMPV